MFNAPSVEGKVDPAQDVRPHVCRTEKLLLFQRNTTAELTLITLISNEAVQRIWNHIIFLKPYLKLLFATAVQSLVFADHDPDRSATQTDLKMTEHGTSFLVVITCVQRLLTQLYLSRDR